MTSEAPLKDIDEQFLRCCICMERLKEPKCLPCLHCYCQDCLKKVFKEAKKIECPTCREEHTLPRRGIDGLKTDFNTKNIIEFIQLQESVKQESRKICAGCTKKLKASAYCFRCNDFLCQACHGYHTTSKIVKDHRNHIFSLSEAEARDLTIQKLSSLREAPRCHTHPEKLSELCCTTCDNLPICMPCTHGAHRGHHLEEVTSLAKILREKLTGKVADLMKYREKMNEMQGKIRKTKEKLDGTVEERRRRLQDQLDAEEEEIKKDLLDTERKLQEEQTELEEKLAKKTLGRKKELEKEIREANQKYERVCDEERGDAAAEFEKLQQENERDKRQLQEGLDATNNNIKELLASLKTREEENTKRIEELSDHYDNILKKFETVSSTASSVLAAKHDWTDVQCIPDICSAIDPLIEELRKDHPELQTMTAITMKGASSLTSRKGKVDISEREESVVDIEGIGYPSCINDITSSKDGSIIITGRAPGLYESHITVIKRNGKRLRQGISLSYYSWPCRFCATLSESTVATVCESENGPGASESEIGVYGIRNGTHKKACFSGFDSSGYVTSVAIDPTNNNIIVGGHDNTQLYVYNDQLEYSHSLTLPNGIRNIQGITIHDGNLLICDNVDCRAYAITMVGTESKLVYEFTKPEPESYSLEPVSVCTDKNGYIYMMWVDGTGSTVAQYSSDDGQLLTTRFLDEEHYSECMTAVDTEEGEKLMMATYRTGKLFTYSLC